jgi:bifunctional non-homologous end joining protein LigD
MPRRPSDPLPDFIEPELAVLTKRAPDGNAWVHEIKLDGYRTAARSERGQVAMLTGRGLAWTARSGPIVDTFAGLGFRAHLPFWIDAQSLGLC